MTECNKCGYEWDYTGKLNMATCPSCGYKTTTAEDDEDDKS
jgi:DNA-directed RNA polymerase subunit RPC12/RpoP